MKIEGTAKEIADFVVEVQKSAKSNEFVPCNSNGLQYSKNEKCLDTSFKKSSH